MAIKMLELRLNEISPTDTVYKLLFEYKELVSYCVNCVKNMLSGV